MHGYSKSSITCLVYFLQVCWRVLAGNFDVSMFERLLSNNFPHVILNVQGRMHPELVDLYSYHYGSEIKSAQGLEVSNDGKT